MLSADQFARLSPPLPAGPAPTKCAVQRHFTGVPIAGSGEPLCLMCLITVHNRHRAVHAAQPDERRFGQTSA